MSDMKCVHGIYIKQKCYDCLRSLLENTEKDLTDLAWRYSILQKENALLKSCVEFYGDKNNWSELVHLAGTDICFHIKDEIEEMQFKYGKQKVGGKKAREVLRELEGGE